MKFDYLKNVAVIALCIGLASVCSAQTAPAPQTADQKAPAPGAELNAATPAEPHPTALPTPTYAGPLIGTPTSHLRRRTFRQARRQRHSQRHGPATRVDIVP